MLPGPTERFVPEAEDAVEEGQDPNPCEEDEEFFNSRPDAEEMEAAISKFLDAMPALELDGFQHLHKQLARLPLPSQKGVSSMGHDEAVEGGLLKTMSEEELKRFTPSELLLYKHAQEYRYILEHNSTYTYVLVHTRT